METRVVGTGETTDLLLPEVGGAPLWGHRSRDPARQGRAMCQGQHGAQGRAGSGGRRGGAWSQARESSPEDVVSRQSIGLDPES